MAELLVDIGARSWMVILTAAMGRAADRPSLLLHPYHLLYLFPLLADIKREKLDPNGIAFFPGNNVGYFGPLAETLRYGSEFGQMWDGCGAGVSALGIEADGQIERLPVAANVGLCTRKHSRPFTARYRIASPAGETEISNRALGLLQELPVRRAL